MDLSVHFYYWHEKLGPLLIYSKGDYTINEEQKYMLLSSVEPYAASQESSLSGPHYVSNRVMMVYNRTVNNPEAKDERVRLMGSDCWVVISTEKNHEIILKSKINIVKMILDIEFENCAEITQLNASMADRAAKAITDVFLDKK
ncbi:MAG: hypothetical protein U9O98_10545 [Asgard group archaeon]|nr:hypothetical protein [Asgard group archaeon]